MIFYKKSYAEYNLENIMPYGFRMKHFADGR